MRQRSKRDLQHLCRRPWNSRDEPRGLLGLARRTVGTSKILLENLGVTHRVEVRVGLGFLGSQTFLLKSHLVPQDVKVLVLLGQVASTNLVIVAQ